MRTVLGTILVLTAMQAVFSSKAAAGRVGGALQGLGDATRYLISPSVPLIPDLRTPRQLRPGYVPTPQDTQDQRDLLGALGSPLVPFLPPVEGQ